MLPVIEAAQGTDFDILIPPVSVAKWAEYYNNDELEYRLDGYEYILSLLVQYDNVTIYGFDDVYELTNDLNKYCDTIHYDSEVNEWLLKEIAAKNHIISRDNYTNYVNLLKEYYLSYDFTTLNQYIE